VKTSTALTSLRASLLRSAAALLIGAATLTPTAALAQRNNTLPEAQAFFNQGDLRSANTVLRNVLRDNPNDGAARILAARLALAAGNGAGAQAEIDRARAAGVSRDNTRTIMAEAMIYQRRFADATTELATNVPAQFQGEAARIRGLAFVAQNRPAEAIPQLVQAERLQPRDVQTKIDLARGYAMARDVRNAEAAIDRALALNPRSVRALLIKGDLTRSSQGLARGLAFFDQALQIDPNSLEGRLERAATLVDLRRETEARQEIDRINKLAPQGHPLALYLDAVLRTRKQEYQEAQALMQRTRGVLDNYPPAMLLQGLIAYETNNMEQAEKFLDAVLKVAPDSPVARRLYGATLLRRGDADGTIKALEPLVKAGQADSRLLALLGSAYARKNEFNTAVRYFEQAVQREPNQAALRAQLAMSRVALGQNVQAMQDLQAILRIDPRSLQALTMTTLIDLRSRNFQSSLASAQRLVQNYPELPLAYNMRAASYLGLNRLKEAEADFRTALQKRPDYHEARRNLAQLYRLQGRFDLARRELTQVLESDRNNVRTLLALADVAAAQNRREEQIQWLRRAATANPKDLLPRLSLVNVLLQTGDRTRALEEAAAVDRDFPNNPAAIETLGLAQLQTRDFSRAISTYQRLVNLQPNSIPARMLLARAYTSANQPLQARNTYRAALQLQGPQRGALLVDLMGFEAAQKQFDTALSYAAELRRAFPGQNVADATIGDLYLGAGRNKEAAASYEAARKVGNTRLLTINLSRAYQRLNQPDNAVRVLNDWLRTSPQDAPVRLQVANVLLEAGRYPQAAAAFEAIRRGGNNSPAVLNNLAWSYNRMNDPRAIQFAEAAYKAAPDSPEIADTLGWILVQRNRDVRRGLTLIQGAAAKMKNAPDVQYHLAFALRANGRPQEAIRVLDQLLAGNPRNFENLNNARALLSQLRATGR
jgi:cellulose synthase operon protein C